MALTVREKAAFYTCARAPGAVNPGSRLRVNLLRSATFDAGAPCEGTAMSQQQQPSKETVRAWLRTRREQKRPPPDAVQIRRELGWELVRPAPQQRR